MLNHVLHPDLSSQMIYGVSIVILNFFFEKPVRKLFAYQRSHNLFGRQYTETLSNPCYNLQASATKNMLKDFSFLIYWTIDCI